MQRKENETYEIVLETNKEIFMSKKSWKKKLPQTKKMFVM